MAQTTNDSTDLQSCELIVHLDMKGAHPTVAYLQRLFPYLRDWGATGLLIEWEDTLPYEGPLGVVRHPEAYSAEDVATILESARAADLSVTPLVQTFGHLEFVLKHAKFEGLREDPENYMDLCPEADGAQELVRELLRQVVALHPACPRMHIGCDEVFSLGSHPASISKASRDGSERLFLDHVLAVVDCCESLGVRPILWHDMMDRFPPAQMAPLAARADIAVWSYGVHVEDALPPGLWNRLAEAGARVWGASAFKGASTPDAVWTPWAKHAANHDSWSRRAELSRLQGVILTGWARFNHTAALCETLPAAMPCLALCLGILRNGGYSESLRHAVWRGLGLPPQLPLHHRLSDLVTLAQMDTVDDDDGGGDEDDENEGDVETGDGVSTAAAAAAAAAAEEVGTGYESMRQGATRRRRRRRPGQQSQPQRRPRRSRDMANRLGPVNDGSRAEFPGAAVFTALAEVEIGRMTLARTEDNRRLFAPPFTHRLNPPMWRKLETAVAAALDSAATSKDQLELVAEDVFTPLGATEVIQTKVSLLEAELKALLDDIGSVGTLYGPGGARQWWLEASHLMRSPGPAYVDPFPRPAPAHNGSVGQWRAGTSGMPVCQSPMDDGVSGVSASSAMGTGGLTTADGPPRVASAVMTDEQSTGRGQTPATDDDTGDGKERAASPLEAPRARDNGRQSGMGMGNLRHSSMAPDASPLTTGQSAGPATYQSFRPLDQ